jgi:RHS repeat-associated protein
MAILKRLLSGLLIVAHIALVTPLSEVFAMESANFKVNQNAVSSGGGNNAGATTVIPYSNAAESAIGNAESANYKVSLGYINAVASNPPIFRSLIPDANMRIVWDKEQPCPVLISLDTFFLSPDSSPLTYQVEGNSNIAVVIDPHSHIASFTQVTGFSGSELVRFVATDANLNSTKSNFVALVVKGQGNNRPIIYPINDITVKENELVQVTPTVFDPDGNVLTVTYTSPLDDTGKWQTTYNDAGTYKVTATVSDGTLKASATLNVIVKNVNRPPAIDPIPNITVNEGDLVKLNVVAHDPDGDNVIISYPAPLDADGGWQTTYKDAGTYNFTVTASDSDLSTTSNVKVIVNPVNAPPLVQLYADKTSPAANETFTVYLLAQDPNGDQLKLTLKMDGSAISGCDNILLDGQAFSKNISIANIGSHTIDAVVTEVGVSGTPNTATDSLKINVDENSSSDAYFPTSGDFNGDGLADLGYYNRALGIWKVQLSNGDGTFGPVEYWISSGFGNNDSYCYPITNDFNGDGRTDAAFVRVPTSNGAGAYIMLALSTGTGFDAQTTNWRSTSAGNLQNDWHYATFTGDFNGDGVTDVGQIRVDSNTSLYVGLTGANLAVSTMENWIKDGSHTSISDFMPIVADFNGDGLTDLCLFNKSAGRWAVTLSKGDRFGDTMDWLTGFGANNDPILGDFNCDGLTDIGYMVAENGQWSIKYAISDGTKFNLNNGQPYNYQTGIPDSVTGTFITGDFNGDGLFDVAVFDKSTHEWTVKLHHSKYPDLLVGIDNGIGGTTTITYKDSAAYENNGTNGLPALPFSIRVVSTVTQSDGLGSSYTTNYFYRDGFFDTTQREFRGFGYVKVIDAEGSYKETYFNQDDIYKGRPSKEVVRDKYEKIYSQVSYDWRDQKLFSDTVDYPYLFEKTSTAYDPNTGASKSSKTTFTYDDYGNAINVKNWGFLDVTGDEQEAHVTYYYDIAKWILSKPQESDIKDVAGNIVASTKYEYYPDGGLKKEEKWLGRIGDTLQWGSADNPTTEFTYYPTGNVETVKDARGNTTITAYDPTKTFPITIQNVLGHTQQFTYNKATGKILTSTDPDSQVTTSQYDTFGRLYHVMGPGNISEVTYVYDLISRPVKMTSTTKVADGKYAKAFSFVDGLGRQILSRVEAEYQGVAKHIVSGEMQYNSRGQVIKKYLPYYINVPTPNDAYIPPQNSTPCVSYEYDAMGRLVKTIRPDNKVSYTIYGINTIEAINENGQHIRQTKDAYGRAVEAEEDTGDLTDYVYDTLGNLTDTYDSSNPRNHVHMDYDTLGRKISMTDPDMGGFAGKSWQYYYDKVGNLVTQIDAKGQSITFQYDAINRLQSKSTSVTYAYDDSAKSNCIGRLSRVTDSSGSTEFFYDILGREIKTTKTIITSSYTIERTYDSLDRLVTVKYPDNSVVTYTYNKQGGISTVTGDQGTAYVSSVNYNANGQIEHIAYGNGTSTDYTYDPCNFRLNQLKTSDPQKAAIQNLSYNFDPIGNVTSIQDSVNSNTQSFQYDNLNRLTESTGNSYGQINYSYNSIGNLLMKGSITMEYGVTAGPHAVTAYTSSGVRKTISYDYNGNMLTKGSNAFAYDVENRLKDVMVAKGGVPFDLSLNLTAGWNFFSLPGFVPNTNNKIKDILSSINGKYDQVSTYDSTQGKWIHYVGDTKFSQFDTFDIGKGYLIYITAPCTLTLSGSFPATSQANQLKAGWNLVAAPTNSTIDPSRAFQGITYDSIAVYNGTGYTYNPATLQKGNAYWIHVAIDQTWSVPLSQVETKYTYDGDGGRVLRQENNEITVYIGSSYESVGPAGQLPDKITKHIFMGSTRICSVEHLRGGTSLSNPSSEVEHVYYYHQDHIGSSNVITDETGVVVNILEYTPFGEVSRSTGNYSTDKRFTGKIWDESSALYYYGARYYDPELGHFITADPTIQHPFDPQDLNRYSYCRNNPINYIDPTGLSWWSSFWKWLSGGIGAIIAAVVIMAVTLVAAVATGGAALTNPFFWAFAGEISGAISGATTAAITGGDIGSGMLTGTVAGGITGGILGPPGGAGASYVQTGINDAMRWSINAVGDATAKIAAYSITTSGVGAGAAITSGWVKSATNRENIASAYEQQIRALRTDSLVRPDKIKVPVSSRYLTSGSFGPKHSFIEESNPPWEMGPSNGKIATSDTVSDLSNWGTYRATASAISSGATSSVTVEVSASGLKEATAIYGHFWNGQPYIATNHNSNYAVNSVIYGAGGDVSGDLGWAPGFPDQP